MLELGISQAQTQFTKLLNQEVTIVDKKNRTKKAVILPFEIYKDLLQKALDKEDYMQGSFSKFAGMLSKDFKTKDSNDKKFYHGEIEVLSSSEFVNKLS